MGRPSWFHVLISLNEDLAKLCVAANNGKCIKLKNNNEKVIIIIFLLFSFNRRGGCGGPQMHRAYGSPHHPRWCRRPSLPGVQAGGPPLLPWALTPSPQPSSCSAAVCWSFSMVSPAFLCLPMFSLLRGFSQLLPHSGPRPVSVCPLKEINVHPGWHLGLRKGLRMISQLQIS